MIDRFIIARERGTPLIAIKTFDPQLTLTSIQTRCAKTMDGQVAPLFVWDCIAGISGINQTAKDFCKRELTEDSTNAVTALEMAAKIPDRSIFVCMNAHRGVTPDINPNWVQAVWNLRGIFKKSLRTLVMLCPDVVFPPELAQDVTMFDEPLPGNAELRTIVKEAFRSAREESPDEALVDKAVDAIAGLSVFAAEQVATMSLRRDTETKKIVLDLEELWSRKAQMIQQTPGLSVYKGKETFDKIGGYGNLKTFLTKVIGGSRKPNAVIFVDEIEKAFAGATGGTSDSSGVSQGFLGTLLSYMQDNECSGVILIGPPGTAKSAFAKAFSNTGEVPCISFELTGMKQGLVGSSEANLRNALKVVTAVSQGRAFFVATCNRIASLPPELRRRFKSGTFFLDLPGSEERAAIWDLYRKSSVEPLPDDEGWSGAEIKQCCYLAYEELCCTLVEAAQYIVPVAKSAERQIQELRLEASGRFISASYPGYYKHEGKQAVTDTARLIGEISE